MCSLCPMCLPDQLLKLGRAGCLGCVPWQSLNLCLEGTSAHQHSACSQMGSPRSHLLERLEVAFALAHLLTVQHEVPVAAHGAGPLVRLVRPDSSVVVQGHGEVVANQVLHSSHQGWS